MFRNIFYKYVHIVLYTFNLNIIISFRESTRLNYKPYMSQKASTLPPNSNLPRKWPPSTWLMWPSVNIAFDTPGATLGHCYDSADSVDSNTTLNSVHNTRTSNCTTTDTGNSTITSTVAAGEVIDHWNSTGHYTSVHAQCSNYIKRGSSDTDHTVSISDAVHKANVHTGSDSNDHSVYIIVNSAQEVFANKQSLLGQGKDNKDSDTVKGKGQIRRKKKMSKRTRRCCCCQWIVL